MPECFQDVGAPGLRTHVHTDNRFLSVPCPS